MRARDLGVAVGTGTPGPANAITDVPGTRVGHCTLTAGPGTDSAEVHTGVTVVLPHDDGIWSRPVFAGSHRLNGNGELTGLQWVRESGMLTSPIGLTNSHSVGVVRDALARVEVARRAPGELFWALPVVGETWDGVLNDIDGFHVRAEHLERALASAVRSGDGAAVAEGNVGAGTGTICHGFKGGIGTSSRVVVLDGTAGYTVGVLVQANHGRRDRLLVDGVPVGRLIDGREIPVPIPSGATVPVEGGGSIIVVVATDAPLLPHQCDRLAQRASLGVARAGGVGEHFSGDLVIAFATGNRLRKSEYGAAAPVTQTLTMLSDGGIDALFAATVEATEESILNALVAARTVTGRAGVRAHALPHSRLVDVLVEHGRPLAPVAVRPDRPPLPEEMS
ncbi:P1 family peptidase [Pseudonocardia sp. ICBG1142]|uniref:DmpA family aminopeptidase n=1 Tax=Pseudonocardia sp. ICBG1142 TaxID=2846760 RepID=UPI001CF61D4F|nr:P1 family peptidase [Pseudonocardia sp. ICBG1142]